MRRLTQRRVDALKPRKAAYEVRDAELKGFGVRVGPSGKKGYFLHSQRDGRRIWKFLGGVETISADEARSRAAAALSASRHEPPAGETSFETVAEEAFRRYGRRWKTGTLAVNRSNYRSKILPWFKGKRIAEIGKEDVRQWFASLRETPAAADRSIPILSVIMRQAELYGYRPEDSNPCKGIKRYGRAGRERFLSADEIGRLAAALARHGAAKPLHVAAITLLLLTGCRKSEILTLKWTDYRDGKLFLADGKTGPRTVWLSASARELLAELAREGKQVFYSRGATVDQKSLGRFWRKIREEADLGDVRLHDLRHTYASMALAQGETVLTIGRLLGHRDPATTLKYAHLADAAVRQAVEAVGAILEG